MPHDRCEDQKRCVYLHMGNHRHLETILELYMPLIEHHSYLYVRVDEDLKQYILIHIALNISKFKI